MSKFLILLLTFTFAQDYSLQFDGVDDYVSLPVLPSAICDIGSSSTLTVSYKGTGSLFEGTVTSPPIYPILFRVEGVNSQNGFSQIKTYHRSADLSVNQEPATGNISDDSVWNTIIITFDNQNGHYQLFFNNESVIDYDFNPSSFFSNNLVWIIGKHPHGGTNHFNGIISEITLWNFAFTDSDVSNFNNGNLVPQSNSVFAAWNFNEGEGDTVYDLSSNGNHGTIYGATWSTDVPIPGCTDPFATNYNPDADFDDGSCEYDFPEVDFDLFTYIGQFGDNYYYISDYQADWYTAKSESELQGGHLITISDMSENNFVLNNYPNSGMLWIGLTDEEVEDNWEWITEEPFVMENWESVSPNGGTNENYGAMNGDGSWDDRHPNYSWFYIMEIESEPTPQPTNYSLDPTEMDFGEVELGQSATQTLWFNSAGNGNVEVTDIITGDEIDVSMTAFTLWNGATIPVEVTFTPNTEGSFTDSLVIYSDDPEVTEFTYNLTATAVANPNIVVTPTQLNYEIHLNEAEEQTQTLSIENTGYDTLEVSLGNGGGTGFALEFDGVDDYVDFGNPSGWMFNDFSIACWFKTAAQTPGPGSNYQGLITKDCNGCGQDFSFIIGLTDNGDISFNGEGIGYVNSSSLNDGVWHYVVGTRNGTTGHMELFVDGIIVDTNNGPPGTITNSNNFHFGKYYPSNPNWYEGTLNIVSIWSAVLTQEEILINMYAELTGDEEGLVGYWNFNEGEGNILHDLSGNGNDGTIYGATWVESPFSQSVDWLTLSETTLTILPGESANVDVTANGAGLEYGDYEATIQLTSNDPNNPVVEVPITMSVQYPIAEVLGENIEFGEIGFNSIENYELGITNVGNDDLEVYSVLGAGNLALGIQPDTLTVSPSDTGYVSVTLTSTLEEMSITDTLLITTNENPISNFQIPISATVVPNVRPIITAITDVPNDQGGRVYITFSASFYDTDTLRNTESYQIERLDESWVGVATQNAYGSSTYTVEASTLYDLSDTYEEPTEFRIIANMDEGNFVSLDDENGIGFSIDNIHPTPPELTSSEHEDMDVTFHWQYELEEDYREHEVSGLYVNASTTNNQHTFTLDDHDEHNVQSEDIHGNLSGSLQSIFSMDLHEGANLKSFNVLPEDNSIENVMASIEGNATGVIGQGVAANYMDGIGWMGSLSAIHPKSGYWIIVSEADVLLLIGVPTSRDLAYTLDEGANLISYPFRYQTDLEAAIPQDAQALITGIIGEGVAANNMDGTWMGSLNNIEGSKGYWFITTGDLSLTFNGCDSYECAILFRKTPQMDKSLANLPYKQSTRQAFYFIERIDIKPSITTSDWVVAKKGETILGARKWNGAFTDIPVMGMDERNPDYAADGDVIDFYVVRSNGKELQLESPENTWTDLGMFMVESLSEMQVIPNEYALLPAYPNPFNPVTTISFGLPEESNVSLVVYDLQGRIVETLLKSQTKAGYHHVTWDAQDEASGVYFVKLTAGTFTTQQKVLLVK